MVTRQDLDFAIYMKRGGRGKQLKYPWLTLKMHETFLLPGKTRLQAKAMVYNAHKSYWPRKYQVEWHKDKVKGGMVCPLIRRVA